MIIIGDKLVPSTELFKIFNIEDIKNTEANSTLYFLFNDEILKYCFENSLDFAVKIESIKEAIYANALNAKYIIAEKKLAKKIQKIAENYMFDSKVLAIIETNDEFEDIAKVEIDGVIYKESLLWKRF